jgi:hypothetical protein
MRPRYVQVKQAKWMLLITLILTKQQGYHSNIYEPYSAAERKEFGHAELGDQEEVQEIKD